MDGAQDERIEAGLRAGEKTWKTEIVSRPRPDPFTKEIGELRGVLKLPLKVSHLMKCFESNQTMSGKTVLPLAGDHSKRIGLEFQIRCGEFGQVESATVETGGGKFDMAQFKETPQVSGRVNSGEHVILAFDSDNVTESSNSTAHKITGDIKRLKTLPFSPPGHGAAVWVYTVLNLKLTRGDLVTCDCTPSGKKYLRDTVQFEVGGRTWFLRDDLHGFEQKETEELRKASDPIRSGHLWTEIRDGDDDDEVDNIASIIATLLALALSSSIRLELRHRVNPSSETGEFPKTLGGWVAPMKSGRSRTIPDEKKGVLKKYLERTYSTYARDPEWFERTIELYMQGVLSSVIDVKLIFFSMLMDRIATKLVTNSSPQIDANLKYKLKDQEFRGNLHRLLAGLSNNWTMKRTEALINTITQWNSEPPLHQKVALAAEKCGLPAPDPLLVKPRHAILHEGEIKQKFGSLSEFYRKVDETVLFLILRMLGYDGVVCSPVNRMRQIVLADIVSNAKP